MDITTTGNIFSESGCARKLKKGVAESHPKVPLEILVVAAVEVAAALLVAVVPKAVEG